MDRRQATSLIHQLEIFWAITILAIDVGVIWALTAHGRDVTPVE